MSASDMAGTLVRPAATAHPTKVHTSQGLTAPEAGPPGRTGPGRGRGHAAGGVTVPVGSG
ncbi:hypothetical protein Pve01_37130 [Planomonospora venezuelensis]|nr:hypothetical protein Pve01_37130 [Planomonospora venezuelensis]